MSALRITADSEFCRKIRAKMNYREKCAATSQYIGGRPERMHAMADEYCAIADFIEVGSPTPDELKTRLNSRLKLYENPADMAAEKIVESQFRAIACLDVMQLLDGEPPTCRKTLLTLGPGW